METYNTKGVCSKEIQFKIIDNIVTDIFFKGGCDGNLKGLAKLANNRNVREVIDTLSGITCGKRSTSCPDQLAKALKEKSNF